MAEVRTSWLQSELLSRAARSLTFRRRAGTQRRDPVPERRALRPAPRLRRVCPRSSNGCARKGFTGGAAGAPVARHLDAIDRGAFPIYHEKTAAGLPCWTTPGPRCSARRYPERTYADFDAVPRLIIDSLLFIENRELLDGDCSRGAIRRSSGTVWPPVLRDSVAKLVEPGPEPARRQHACHPDREIPPCAGRPHRGRRSKLRQMVSASLRAYRDGPDTSAVRRQIVVDYLNSTPLSARTGFGEVNGLGDGLWAWFGTDFVLANRLLQRAGAQPRSAARAGPGLQAGAEPAARPAPAVLLPDRRPRGDPRADRCAPAPARRGPA